MRIKKEDKHGVSYCFCNSITLFNTRFKIKGLEKTPHHMIGVFLKIN